MQPGMPLMYSTLGVAISARCSLGSADDLMECLRMAFRGVHEGLGA
jgi:hypothetical protein